MRYIISSVSGFWPRTWSLCWEGNEIIEADKVNLCLDISN